MLEEKWKLCVSGNVLEVADSKSRVQRINLDDIKRITIQTNDSGPLDSDVIWRISNERSTISFPMGATGENDAMEAFQKFKGFDNLELIKAMSSTDNHIFILFEK